MYALVDGNNFYVSCERVFRPSLNGRPVVGEIELYPNDEISMGQITLVLRANATGGSPRRQTALVDRTSFRVAVFRPISFS